MATEVVMPKMGYDMEEGTILRWAKQEGDEVAKGEVLGEIETGKVNIEIEAFDAGVLRKILVDEGQTVPVGEPIAIIGAADEAIEIPESSAPARNGRGRSASADVDEADAASAVGAEAADGAARGEAGRDGRLRASPLARRLAEEHDIPLEALEGSGPKGRVLRDDVRRAIEQGLPARPEPRRASGETPAATPLRLGEGDRREDLSAMRRTIARRLGESWQAAPHIFLTLPIEMDAALALRKQVNASLEATGGGKVSVNDLVIKAAALALRRHPRINVSWDAGARVLREQVTIGVAVALDDGLITLPVVEADRRPISAIAAEVAGKAERAREGRLQPEDLAEPSSFTISNLGGYGIEQFTAIINPPEAAILAVGRATPQPVVVDGEVVVRSIMRVTLSADHRVVDGATAAEFLGTLRQLLEQPLAMLV